MAVVFCVANQKGGVGKTTTTLNLAAALAESRKRVLVVDMDPQGNATSGSGVDKNSLTETVYPLLLGNASLSNVLQHCPLCGYDLIPSNCDLAAAEKELWEVDERDRRLKGILQPLLKNYDVILIDCPPSLTLLTVNAFCAADGILVPMQCEYYAMEGLVDLHNTVSRIQSGKNPGLRAFWLLRVMFDSRINLQQQVSEQLDKYFGDKVFKTLIPRNSRLAEAPSHGLPGISFDRHCKGSLAYQAFAKEFIKKIKALNK